VKPEVQSLFPISVRCDDHGHLHLAGQRLTDLARDWGTPLYLYDAATVLNQLESLRVAVGATYPGGHEITYAAKAYFSLSFARCLTAWRVGVDVVSLGELAIARRAGMTPDQIHLHGNNKTPAELTAALEGGVQAIVVDSLDELDLLENIAGWLRRPVRIWLRIAPGVSAATHAYSQTGHHSTKFGLAANDGQAVTAIGRAKQSQWLKLAGLHMHIGSQISEPQRYREGIQALYTVAREANYCPEEFSPGGGWYVRYLPEDPVLPLLAWVETVSQTIQEQCWRSGWPLPKLILEPGRWLVARAGLALYTIGACKQSGDGTRWVAVDGGMADNPRPALYGARYAALPADNANATATQTVKVVGKYCETGDFLIAEAQLPEVKRGECLVMPVAGAYQLSMASNYNLSGRPAVLWVTEGGAEVMQPREDVTQSTWWMGPSTEPDQEQREDDEPDHS
jgi:diaminopimelate decarboxylase